MRRFKKWLIGLVLFFVVFTLFGFFGVPPILKSVLVKKMSEALKREVTIEKIKVEPLYPFRNRGRNSDPGTRGIGGVCLLR